MNNHARDVLSEILENGIDVHRCGAARALGQLPTASPVAVLTKALLDEDPDVRIDAAAALGACGDPSCAEALMENLLGDTESDVKKEAISALVDFRHEPIVALLRELVTGRSSKIAWDEDEYYQEGWDSWVDIQIAAIQGLGKFGDPEAVPLIVAAMQDEYGQDITHVSLGALACMGKTGMDAIVELYVAGDDQLRRRIADAVSGSGDELTHGLISAMLEDTSARVREITVLGMDAGDPRLEALLGDKEPGVRAAVVRHTRARNPEIVTSLISDQSPAVRIEVFKVIAAQPEVFSGEKTAALVRKSMSGDPAAAIEAALAWIALKGPDGIEGLTHTMTNSSVPLAFRVGVVEALKKAGSVSVPHLLKAAGDEERQLRLASLTALVDFAADDPIWPNRAGEGLLAALNGELVVEPPEADEEQPDDTPENAPEDAAEDTAEKIAEETPEDTAQDTAQDTTEESGSPEGEDSPPVTDEPAQAILEEEQEIDATLPLQPEGVTTSTLDAILSGPSRTADAGPAKEPDPIELSEKETRMLDLSRRRSMAKRKMSLESDIAPYLDVRRFAAQLLGGVVNADVTEVLIAALAHQDSEVALGALNSLVLHGEKNGSLPASAYEPLKAILAGSEDGSRILATRALAWMAGEDALSTLAGLLEDPSDLVRADAVRALDEHGIADERTERCLKDKYVGVAIAASQAVARHRGEDGVNALVEFAFEHDGTYRRDVGRLLATYAPEAGVRRLLEVLQDNDNRRNWLVALDALSEIFAHWEQSQSLKVA